LSTSKTGKHGHDKAGIDIIANRKYEDICPSTDKWTSIRPRFLAI
jgi:hypothetical protein